MAFTPINIPGASVGNNTEFQPISFDQARQGLASINNVGTQQLQQQNQQPAPSPMNSTGSAVTPTGGGMFSNLMNNIKKVPGQVMSIANKITAPGSGMNTAVQALSSDEANIANVMSPTESLQQKEQIAQNLPQTNPLQSMEAGAEIAAVMPGDTGAAGAATKAAEGKAGELMAASAEKKATQVAVKALTPKMTAGELETAAKAGKGVVPKVGAPGINSAKDSGFMKMVNTVKGLVKGKSAIEDINSVRGAISTEAEALKSKVVASGKDIIYPFQELASKIDGAEEPISLKGTPFEKQIAPIKAAAIKIAQKNGGTISSLLDSRKEFDALVNKTYPNLFDKDNAPMRNAVTAVRDAMNDFIEENLPDVAYKDSLETQRTMYNAIDNLATKVPDEIKQGATFAQRHPKTVGAAKWLGGGALAGAGLEAVQDAAKKIGL